MDREEKLRKLRHDAWDKAKNPQDRIRKLEKVVSEYPKDMTPLSDIAVSYLQMDEVDNAIKMYQNIIDLKDTFNSVWENELGKAYLFTNNFDKAIKTLEVFEKHGHDVSNGLFIAFTYLKKDDRKKFKEQFDKWISKNIEKSFDQYFYRKYIKALFDEKESKFIEKVWDKYYEKYFSMEPYNLYCELYKQYYDRPETDEEDFDDGDDYVFTVPDKLSRSEFEELRVEYLYLDRKTMFGDADDADYDRLFELGELLFADTVIG